MKELKKSLLKKIKTQIIIYKRGGVVWDAPQNDEKIKFCSFSLLDLIGEPNNY